MQDGSFGSTSPLPTSLAPKPVHGKAQEEARPAGVGDEVGKREVKRRLKWLQ